MTAGITLPDNTARLGKNSQITELSFGKNRK
jgi:hypothetical protein